MSRAKPRDPVAVRRDGREVCDTETASGRREYLLRKAKMLIRQNGRCCYQIHPLCPRILRLESAVFAHENPRGMGGANRDDRIEIDGKRVNGASCEFCNSLAGSRRIPMKHGGI